MKFNKPFFFILILFLISFYLRTYLIQQNLFFGPEQGIDFLAIKDIALNHNFTLIGSKTDVSGIFHGPAYYYLAAVPFLISQGDPVFVTTFFIFLNALTAIFIFYLGKEIKNTRLGFIAAILFTVSYQAIIFSRWPSSPPLGIPLVTLFNLFFYRFLRGSKKDLLFAAIAFGLLNQIEFLHIVFYSVIAVALFILYFKQFKKLNKLYLAICILIAILTTAGTYILFDLRHNFLISKSLIALASGETGYGVGIFPIMQEIWTSTVRVFMKTILPQYSLLSIILLLGGLITLIVKIRKKKNTYLPLVIWLTMPIILLVIFRHAILDHFFVSLIPLFILLTALFIDAVWQKNKFASGIILVAICLINLSVYLKNIPNNQDVFFQSTQPELRYSDQLATIDDIYKDAQKKPFSFQSYTIPYFSQQGWEYLFWYRGFRKYGYSPIEQKAKILYVIIQDDPSNKPFQNDWLKNTVSKWGKPAKTFQHGIITTIKLDVR